MDCGPKRSRKEAVKLKINGVKFTVGEDVPGDTSLNTFIREHAHLKGTKVMCREGGCGACIVSAISPGSDQPLAVNSCQVPVYSCDGWEVTTVEGLGTRRKGYNRVVRRLAAANGTQCGYCSPGMVMNMYSLLEANPNITMKEVENSFGGNICRCTGYRPILDAFKSLASDAPERLVKKLCDIEDLICPTSGKVCDQNGCANNCVTSSMAAIDGLELQLADGSLWYRPTTLQKLFSILDEIGDRTYRYIAGNTGQGVYRYNNLPDVYIDLKGILELEDTQVTSTGVTLGGNVSLTTAMNFFNDFAKKHPEKFAYFETLASHIDLIANVPVRNTGTLGGNIMMKHDHLEFPSDVFLFLETVGAKLIIAHKNGEEKVSLSTFLGMNMHKKLITKILLPNIDSSKYIVRTYKIMPRAQNAHAYVNAGFKVQLSDLNNKDDIITEKPTILFGGINPSFLHAEKTEAFFDGKVLLSNETLKGALEILEMEMTPDHVPPDPSPEFRKGLALSLLYKFILSVMPQEVQKNVRSGGKLLERPLSSAKQDYQTNPSVWPLNQPVPKIEALIQCSGEAEYSNDIPSMPGQLWGQLVLSEYANVDISGIDPTEALKMPGVVAFLSAKDIPGKNTFILPHHMDSEEEQIFATDRARYAGEALGVIFAETQSLARRAADLVKIVYSNQQKVMLDVRQIIKENIPGRIQEIIKVEGKNTGDDVKHVVKGSWDLKGQYHYTMETQTCVAVPAEDHLEVFAATQWPTCLQETICTVLKIPENYIDIRVRRLGGAYGSKITRSNHVGVVASLGAFLLNRPIRIALDMETNTAWCGKRCPVASDYEVGVSEIGKIQYLKITLYEDFGYLGNDSPLKLGVTLLHMKNGYDDSRWSVNGYGVKTDTATTTWCRAPEGCCFSIDIRVRRLGGAYGSKITRSNHVGVVASLGAFLLNRPIRIALDMETNTAWCGKRCPVASDYEVGVSEIGKIQYLKITLYEDFGYLGNDSPLKLGVTLLHMKNGYDDSRWSVNGYGVKTDTATTTWCRAPGSAEGIAFIENIMEHISKVIGVDPISVRLANVKEDKIFIDMIDELRKSSNYDRRLKEIEEFNKVNRWKKRGISFVPMNYPFAFWGNFYGMVDIFGMDGSVAITHGAIEMGQGVNTKVAQVAAHVLGVPLDRVTVKPTMTITSPNNAPTGGSLGSEAVSYAIKVCCEQLNERLKPVREKLGEKASWAELCRAAVQQDINLSYTYMFTNKDDVKNYAIYGIVVSEIELDILTGQYHTLRVDLLEDAGESLSPEVDIGQAEGAFVMGMGYYTCEELVYCSNTGRLLTNRTWNYKPPGAKDIPIDFRITFKKNAPNPTGVLRSKATGEPPLCISCSVAFAIRNALLSARQDSGCKDVWLDLDPPFTGEKIWLGALTRKEMFHL